MYDFEYFIDGKYTSEVDAMTEIQRGALRFIIDCEKTNLRKLNFNAATAFQNLNQIANHPRLKDVNLFRKFKFYNNGTKSYLIGSNSLIYNLTHIRMFKEDLYKSRWRIGFLKKMFKIPMPYHLIFSVLMRMAM